jgi:hypothetical protein
MGRDTAARTTPGACRVLPRTFQRAGRSAIGQGSGRLSSRLALRVRTRAASDQISEGRPPHGMAGQFGMIVLPAEFFRTGGSLTREGGIKFGWRYTL